MIKTSTLTAPRPAVNAVFTFVSFLRSLGSCPRPSPDLSCLLMPSLRQLLAEQAPLLLLDAASARIQVGLLSNDISAWQWRSCEQEAGTGLFSCLEALNFNPLKAKGLLFSEGPGSILGIRSVASALRTWQLIAPAPIWSFRSLDLVLHSLPSPTARVIADARRDTWHMATRTRPMHRVPSSELLSSEDLFTPAHFRQWTKLPAGIIPSTAPYDLSAILPTLLDADLFMSAEHPDAFLHEDPSYATWTPMIHRAPDRDTRRDHPAVASAGAKAGSHHDN